MGVVLDLGAGVGWLERILVGNFGELGNCHPVGVDEVRSSGTVGVIFVETVVEAHCPTVISLPDRLHQLITIIFITHLTPTTITVIFCFDRREKVGWMEICKLKFWDHSLFLKMAIPWFLSSHSHCSISFS